MSEIIKSVMQLIEDAEIEFKNAFGYKPNVKAFGPGRVNIIGEHTDYNNGYVFPMALPMGTTVIGSKNGLNECRVLTLSNEIENKLVSFSITNDGEISKSDVRWVNYVIGVVAFFKCSEKKCFDAVINSSVPLGSGLSSSASLEVAVFTFLEGIYEVTEKLTLPEKAMLCQKAEHEYGNVPCGIMDQFIGFMGKKNHALFIDCKDLSNKLVKFENDFISVLIINSNVSHDLGLSEYPLRRKHCYEAASFLNKKSLREVSLSDLEAVKDKLNHTVYVRARHVISENNRVQYAIEALKNSDIHKLGVLMNESHKSLRYDFEVSCNEVDQLVDIVQSCKGVLGSRMTGGGFGGCTVSLVYKTEIDAVIKTVKNKYIGNPTFYVCSAEDGARHIN